LATAVGFIVLQRLLGLNAFQLSLPPAENLDLARLAQIEATRVNWAAAFFLAWVLMMFIGAVSVRLIVGARPGMKLVSAAAIGLVVLVGALAYWPASVLPPSLLNELAVVHKVSGFQVQPALVSFFCALVTTTVLVTIALGLVLYPVARGTADMDRLLTSQAAVREVLFLVTAWLVIGVIGVGLFHRMAVAALPPGPAAALSTVGASSTVLAGAFYSALVGAAFGPAELILRRGARAAARGAGQSPEFVDKWLTDNGFGLSVPGALMRVVAILGPLLASVIQNIAELK
jgi:hypothetical protein